MTYAIQVLNKELTILEEVVRTWPERLKTEYSEAYKDRKQKVKELKEAINKLS